MQSSLGSERHRSQDSGLTAPRALWPVDLKLTHLDWNPDATLVHFQGQYLTICELDYNILQAEIQNVPKTKAAVDIGEFCLVEDLASARWYRGRVQSREDDLFDVFLIDRGNVLSVDVAHMSSCLNDLFILPPKIVCGFLANVLLLQGCSHSVVEDYFSSLIGRKVTGYIQALLPHKVLLLEAPDINSDLVRHGFGRHVDTDTFLLLVEMLTEVPLKQNIEPVPDLLIEKQRGQEFSFKPTGLQAYKETLSLCGPRLSCGTRARVRVTAAVDPGLFYCQMASKETDLREMSRKLAALWEHSTKERNQKTPENVGLLCSVKGKDGKWYRGFVQFLPVNSQVRVLFIDYGFFESVKVENIHRLPPHLYSPPIMAFPCSLSALSDQDEVVKTQQLSFLKEGLLGGMLDMEISSFDEEKHLHSVTLTGVEDNHLKEPDPIQELPRKEVESVFEKEESSPLGGYLHYETIMDEAFGKTLEAEEVRVDSVFVGYVEHVQNPNHFWIRTQKRNDEFEEMMEKMTAHFSQVKMDEDVLLNPQPGKLCCAIYEEDMYFYRGVVTDTLDHGAEVLFIDFGNIEKVPHKLIKNIPEAFASKSAFAFCCTLFNVFPLDEGWTSTTSDFFRQAVSNKALLVHVVHQRKNKFVVNLYEMGSDNSQSITDLLISSKQADYWNDISKQPVMQNSTDVREKTTGPRYSATSDNSGNTGRNWDFQEEEKNEIKKAQTPATFKALNIKPGFDLAVRCSYINSPSDFWCQPQHTTPALEELMAKIQQYYAANTAPLQAGVSCCVAKSLLDGRWYRAIITEKQRDHARVILVDYGYTMQMKEHDLQAVMPGYSALEGQAFRCTFSNLIEPIDSNSCGNWSAEVCKSLIDYVLNNTKGLRCKVVSQLNVKNKGLCNVVDLYNPQTQQSITNLLVQQGLAREATVSTKQLSTMSPVSFVYSSFDLGPGNKEQVYVTHVSSQWEVYCHLVTNTEIIEELEKKISEESEKMKQASTRAVVRNLCLAKYFDGKWYRGLAHAVQSPLHLRVVFVDYGNTKISEKTHVMFIPRDATDLLYTPVQAVRCCLASVSRDELYADVKEWLDKTVLNKQVTAVIVGKNEDGSFDVELFDGDVNVNEKLRELILSLSPKTKTVVSFDTSCRKTKRITLHTGKTKTSVKCKSQLEGQSSISPSSNPHGGTQFGNEPPKKRANTKSYAHDKTEHKNTTVKQQNEDNIKSCVSAQPQKNSQVKQQIEHRDTNTKSERRQHPDIPQLLCLPEKKVGAGLRVKCFISHVDSVGNFFLQLSEDEPAILEMAEELNSGVFRKSLKTATSLRIGDLVLAEYEEDGALYRAVVKDFEGSCSFKVEFVDYGNSAVVGKENVCVIPKEYLSQPRFSISCFLSDTSSYENDASFTDAVNEKPLMVVFLRQDETRWEVMVEILVSETETTKSETITPVVVAEGENVTPKTRAVKLSTKLDVKTCRCRRRRRTANKSDLKRNLRETSTSSSVTAMRVCVDAFIPPTIRAEERESGELLSVQSNGNFYVRLAKNSYLLAMLEKHIADNLYKRKTVVSDDVRQGLKCLVQKENAWRRAVVQQVAEEKCQVFLVDHGITEETPRGSMRQQCGGLANIPGFAVLCKMNCVELSEGEDAHKLWRETLEPMIGKEVSLVFVRYSEADKVWMVEIVVNGLFLVRQITASPRENEAGSPSSAETPNDAAEEEPSLDTTRPQQLAFAPIDMDKEYCGFVAAVTTPFEFCVVLEDFLLIMNQVSITLDDLPEQMSPLPEAHLVHGTCCLLKSDSKNKWCRSEVVHVDTTVVLNLVDYGHCECVPHKDHSKLRRLPEELLKLPKVTYPCILRGVKPVGVDEQWTDDGAVFFQQCLYQRSLQIFFREFVSNTHWKVDVLADGVHVAKELVDAGHATYIDVMLGLRFQERSPRKDPPQGPDSEEECGQEDEGSEWKLNRSAEATEEAEGKMLRSTLSGSNQCFLM